MKLRAWRFLAHTMEIKDRFRISPTVVATVMPTGAVLIDSATGECFELNPIGIRVWECLTRGERLEEIANSLGSEFSVEPSVVSRDIATLIDDLARHRILLAVR